MPKPRSWGGVAVRPRCLIVPPSGLLARQSGVTEFVLPLPEGLQAQNFSPSRLRINVAHFWRGRSRHRLADSVNFKNATASNSPHCQTEKCSIARKALAQTSISRTLIANA